MNVIRHSFHAFYRKTFVFCYIQKYLLQSFFHLAYYNLTSIFDAPYNMVIYVIDNCSCMHRLSHAYSLHKSSIFVKTSGI